METHPVMDLITEELRLCARKKHHHHPPSPPPSSLAPLQTEQLKQSQSSWRSLQPSRQLGMTLIWSSTCVYWFTCVALLLHTCVTYAYGIFFPHFLHISLTDLVSEVAARHGVTGRFHHFKLFINSNTVSRHQYYYHHHHHHDRQQQQQLIGRRKN